MIVICSLTTTGNSACKEPCSKEECNTIIFSHTDKIQTLCTPTLQFRCKLDISLKMSFTRAEAITLLLLWETAEVCQFRENYRKLIKQETKLCPRKMQHVIDYADRCQVERWRGQKMLIFYIGIIRSGGKRYIWKGVYSREGKKN